LSFVCRIKKGGDVTHSDRQIGGKNEDQGSWKGGSEQEAKPDMKNAR